MIIHFAMMRSFNQEIDPMPPRARAKKEVLEKWFKEHPEQLEQIKERIKNLPPMPQEESDRIIKRTKT